MAESDISKSSVAALLSLIGLPDAATSLVYFVRGMVMKFLSCLSTPLKANVLAQVMRSSPYLSRLR